MAIIHLPRLKKALGKQIFHHLDSAFSGALFEVVGKNKVFYPFVSQSAFLYPAHSGGHSTIYFSIISGVRRSIQNGDALPRAGWQSGELFTANPVEVLESSLYIVYGATLLCLHEYSFKVAGVSRNPYAEAFYDETGWNNSPVFVLSQNFQRLFFYLRLFVGYKANDIAIEEQRRLSYWFRCHRTGNA